MNVRQETSGPWDREEALLTTISTIKTLVQDWEFDQPIDAQTRVVADLEFESIDLIQMVSALEQAFAIPGMSLVELLIVDGRYVDDLTIAQIADGICARARLRVSGGVGA
jgi:acyl carrier protein